MIGGFADTGLSRKDVGITGLWILDSDFMVSVRATAPQLIR